MADSFLSILWLCLLVFGGAGAVRMSFIVRGDIGVLLAILGVCVFVYGVRLAANHGDGQ